MEWLYIYICIYINDHKIHQYAKVKKHSVTSQCDKENQRGNLKRLYINWKERKCSIMYGGLQSRAETEVYNCEYHRNTEKRSI